MIPAVDRLSNTNRGSSISAVWENSIGSDSTVVGDSEIALSGGMPAESSRVVF
jgi:hypothetical protein